MNIISLIHSQNIKSKYLVIFIQLECKISKRYDLDYEKSLLSFDEWFSFYKVNDYSLDEIKQSMIEHINKQFI